MPVEASKLVHISIKKSERDALLKLAVDEGLSLNQYCRKVLCENCGVKYVKTKRTLPEALRKNVGRGFGPKSPLDGKITEPDKKPVVDVKPVKVSEPEPPKKQEKSVIDDLLM